MKLLPILLLNILTVGAGVVIYDQLRADTPTAYDEVALSESDLEFESPVSYDLAGRR